MIRHNCSKQHSTDNVLKTITLEGESTVTMWYSSSRLELTADNEINK